MTALSESAVLQNTVFLLHLKHRQRKLFWDTFNSFYIFGRRSIFTYSAFCVCDFVCIIVTSYVLLSLRRYYCHFVPMEKAVTLISFHLLGCSRKPCLLHFLCFCGLGNLLADVIKLTHKIPNWENLIHVTTAARIPMYSGSSSTSRICIPQVVLSLTKLKTDACRNQN